MVGSWRVPLPIHCCTMDCCQGAPSPVHNIIIRQSNQIRQILQAYLNYQTFSLPNCLNYKCTNPKQIIKIIRWYRRNYHKYYINTEFINMKDCSYPHIIITCILDIWLTRQNRIAIKRIPGIDGISEEFDLIPNFIMTKSGITIWRTQGEVPISIIVRVCVSTQITMQSFKEDLRTSGLTKEQCRIFSRKETRHQFIKTGDLYSKANQLLRIWTSFYFNNSD